MDPNDLAKYAIVIIIIYILYHLIKTKPAPALASASSATSTAEIDPQEQFYKDFYAALKIPAQYATGKNSFEGVKQQLIELYDSYEKTGCDTSEKYQSRFMSDARKEKELVGRNSPRMLKLVGKLIKDMCKSSLQEFVIEDNKIKIKAGGKIYD